MKQASLARWLKGIIIGVALCGLAVYAVILPILAGDYVQAYPELSAYRWPWLILLWATGVPCYIALVFAWKIASNIGADRSFSMANAKYLKGISYLALGDTALFFVGNVVYMLLNIHQPGLALLSLLVDFVGVAVAVASAALSHLVTKAAALQDQSDLTI